MAVNAIVFYPDMTEVEVRTVADFTILPATLEATRRLKEAGYLMLCAPD